MEQIVFLIEQPLCDAPGLRLCLCLGLRNPLIMLCVIKQPRYLLMHPQLCFVVRRREEKVIITLVLGLYIRDAQIHFFASDADSWELISADAGCRSDTMYAQKVLFNFQLYI